MIVVHVGIVWVKNDKWLSDVPSRVFIHDLTNLN